MSNWGTLNHHHPFCYYGILKTPLICRKIVKSKDFLISLLKLKMATKNLERATIMLPKRGLVAKTQTFCAELEMTLLQFAHTFSLS